MGNNSEGARKARETRRAKIADAVVVVDRDLTLLRETVSETYYKAHHIKKAEQDLALRREQLKQQMQDSLFRFVDWAVEEGILLQFRMADDETTIRVKGL